MHIITKIEDFHSNGSPIALTIGNFDGVHLGHQAVLQRLKEKSGHSLVVTFSNHPLQVLQSIENKKEKTPLVLITTLSHKLSLLNQFSTDTTLLLSFTESFSKLSAEEFLTSLKQYIPFSFLILGHDARIGYQRTGDSEKLHQLSKKLAFELEYIDPVLVGAKPISSSVIRESIQKGELEETAKLLGRRYSIRAAVEPGSGKGKVIGFQTANINVEGLCLPPLGVYAVEVLHKNTPYLGVANLGFAPTLHQKKSPLLEVHLFDCTQNLYDEEIEVIFSFFLRKEMQFESIDALKNQISQDVQSTRQWFSKRSQK